VGLLVRLRWLASTHVDHWRPGRVDCLERMAQANLAKVTTAMTYFRQWADRRGLVPSETAYPYPRPAPFAVQRERAQMTSDSSAVDFEH
jgi:hypothetical protein